MHTTVTHLNSLRLPIWLGIDPPNWLSFKAMVLHEHPPTTSSHGDRGEERRRRDCARNACRTLLASCCQYRRGSGQRASCHSRRTSCGASNIQRPHHKQASPTQGSQQRATMWEHVRECLENVNASGEGAFKLVVSNVKLSARIQKHRQHSGNHATLWTTRTTATTHAKCGTPVNDTGMVPVSLLLYSQRFLSAGISPTDSGIVPVSWLLWNAMPLRPVDKSHSWLAT